MLKAGRTSTLLPSSSRPFQSTGFGRSYFSSLYGPTPTGFIAYSGNWKPSPCATTLLASPASSAFGDCIEKESRDRIVGKLDVVRVIWTTAVDSSWAWHDL